MGKEAVLTSREDLISFSYDASHVDKCAPKAVVLPTSAKQVQELVRLAGAQGLKLIPRGSGTGLSGATIPVTGGIVVSFTRMNRILEIDTANLTAIVEPGLITAHLAAAIEEHGLFYPPDPGSTTISTIGGNVAENAGGLRGLKYGVTGDYVLGLEAVLANGEIINIGCKSRKNVAGYDVTSLLVGSEGTLAIITQIMLRLIPQPESKRTVLAVFNSYNNATDCINSILGKHHIIPSTLEFMDNITIKCVNQFLKGVLPASAAAMLLIEVDGPSSATENDAGRVQQICRENNASMVQIALNDREGVALANARRAALPALSRIKPATILEDISVPPSRLGEMMEAINRIRQQYALVIGVFGHAGDGNLHPTLLADESDREEMARIEKAIGMIFEKAIALGGTISGEHGIGISKIPYMRLQYPEPVLDVMKNIKRAFDPQNILNPGKVFTDDSRITEH